MITLICRIFPLLYLQHMKQQYVLVNEHHDHTKYYDIDINNIDINNKLI